VDNSERKAIIRNAKMNGYEGSYVDLFRNYDNSKADEANNAVAPKLDPEKVERVKQALARSKPQKDRDEKESMKSIIHRVKRDLYNNPVFSNLYNDTNFNIVVADNNRVALKPDSWKGHIQFWGADDTENNLEHPDPGKDVVELFINPDAYHNSDMSSDELRSLILGDVLHGITDRDENAKEMKNEIWNAFPPTVKDNVRNRVYPEQRKNEKENVGDFIDRTYLNDFVRSMVPNGTSALQQAFHGGKKGFYRGEDLQKHYQQSYPMDGQIKQEVSDIQNYLGYPFKATSPSSNSEMAFNTGTNPEKVGEVFLNGGFVEKVKQYYKNGGIASTPNEKILPKNLINKPLVRAKSKFVTGGFTDKPKHAYIVINQAYEYGPIDQNNDGRINDDDIIADRGDFEWGENAPTSFLSEFNRMKPDLDKEYGEGNYSIIDMSTLSDEISKEDQARYHLASTIMNNFIKIRYDVEMAKEMVDNKINSAVTLMYPAYNIDIDELWFEDHPDATSYNGITFDATGDRSTRYGEADMYSRYAQYEAGYRNKHNETIKAGDKLTKMLTENRGTRAIYAGIETWYGDVESKIAAFEGAFQEALSAFDEAKAVDLGETYISKLEKNDDVIVLGHNMSKVNGLWVSEAVASQSTERGSTTPEVDTWSEIFAEYAPEGYQGNCIWGSCSMASVMRRSERADAEVPQGEMKPGDTYAGTFTEESGVTSTGSVGSWRGVSHGSSMKKVYGNPTFMESFYDPKGATSYSEGYIEYNMDDSKLTKTQHGRGERIYDSRGEMERSEMGGSFNNNMILEGMAQDNLVNAANGIIQEATNYNTGTFQQIVDAIGTTGREMIEPMADHGYKMGGFIKTYENGGSVSTDNPSGYSIIRGDDDPVKSMDISGVNFEDLYKAITRHEHRGGYEEGTFTLKSKYKTNIRTTAKGSGSSAYGDVQLTGTMLKNLTTPGVRRFYDIENVDVAFHKNLLTQSENFLKYGGDDMVKGFERYDYGQSGDLSSDDNQKKYKTLALKILEGEYRRAKSGIKEGENVLTKMLENYYGGDGKSNYAKNVLEHYNKLTAKKENKMNWKQFRLEEFKKLEKTFPNVKDPLLRKSMSINMNKA